MVKRNPVERLFFHYNAAANNSQCLVEGCSSNLTGRHAANLERHIQKLHPKEFELLTKEKLLPCQSNSKVSKTTRQSTLDGIIEVKKKMHSVEIDKQTVIDGCIMLVTDNGRPLSILSDSGLRKIIDPILKAIGSNFTINVKNIQQEITKKYINVVDSITKELNKKLVFLKIDCVTRLSRSIIGINCQFIYNGKIKILTLGMSELLDKHTGSYLKQEVLLVMERYKISPAQIYSITCDNARNMIKMVDLFNETPEEELVDNDEENILNAEDNDDVLLQIQELIHTSGIETGPLTTCMRCAVHSFQLAIRDSMQDRSIQSILSKSRKAVKTLRTQTYAAWLKREGLKQAILDIETRWNSTFNMLSRLIELKPFCITNEQIILSSNDWNSVEKIITALEPAKIATVQMQSNSLTPGDVYGIWLKTQMCLSKIDIQLSKTLIKNMAERQKNIFTNPVFESAIYLDPRYQHLMSVASKTRAVIHLVNTYNLIKNIKNNNDTDKEQDIDDPTAENENIETGFEENVSNDFQLYLQSLSQCVHLSSQSSSSSTGSTGTVAISIMSLLNLFDNQPILQHDENILSYWENKKIECPELYELSQVVMAVPTTQVSVERSFSSLKFVLGDLRSNLGSELLEKIMLIRANKE
ncbi:unnamed protein product [Macrosiphum euphorbiae]|uniref:HAT C-terminal dimerisation domain-containing protein n=1 Tax=Macrosiphum euphorbiae TaxID=13131 RepID=A0AAV0X624_9HEMI|nr:unnamed protein product [Macrosiphum euphorbiae]CAI6363264.1 unnamed protein product [Macrosiphum euphorbiae]